MLAELMQRFYMAPGGDDDDEGEEGGLGPAQVIVSEDNCTVM